MTTAQSARNVLRTASFLSAGACSAFALASPPRYFPQPVPVLERNCGASGLVPGKCTALGEDGSIAGEANCGNTTYGGVGFFLSPEGVLSELDLGSFTFMSPAFVTGTNHVIATADWCPPVNGPCTTALVRASVSGPTAIVASSSSATTVVNDANMLGWSVGWGGISSTGAWRLQSGGALEVLTAPGNGWGVNAHQVATTGFAAGDAYVGNQQRPVVWAPGNSQGAVLQSLVLGTSSSARGVAADGSAVGRSGDRAVLWTALGEPLALLPEDDDGSGGGSVGASEATHIAGNPFSGSPLPMAYFGTHHDDTRLFRATGPNQWMDFDAAAAAGQALTNVEVVAAPTTHLMVARGFTSIYQTVNLLWTAQGGFGRLDSFVVDLPPGLGQLQVVDANSVGNILVNATMVRKSFLLTPLAEGDTNGDHLVNGVDLGRVLGAWGAVPSGMRGACDFDGDGKVDGADLGVVLSNWTR